MKNLQVCKKNAFKSAFFSLEDAHSGFSLKFKDRKFLDLTHVLSHQKLHARFVIKNVPELPEIPDTLVVSLNDLDNYAFSRLTLNAIEKLLIPHHS